MDLLLKILVLKFYHPISSQGNGFNAVDEGEIL